MFFQRKVQFLVKRNALLAETQDILRGIKEENTIIKFSMEDRIPVASKEGRYILLDKS